MECSFFIPLKIQGGDAVREKNKNSSFRRFLVYIKPYWLLITIAAVGGIVKFGVPLIFPQIMRYFIDEVLDSNSKMSFDEKLHMLNYLSVVIIAVYLFIWLPFTYIRHYAVGKASNNVIFDLRNDLYMHIQRLSAAYFKDNQSGEVVSRLINDIALAQNMIGNALTNVWIDGAIVIVLLFIMFKMNVILTLVSLSILPLHFLTIQRIGSRVKKNSKIVQDEIAEITGIAQERISGFSVVKAFAREKFEQINFLKECYKLFSFSNLNAKLSSINTTIIGFLTGVAPVLVVWTAGQLILREKLTVGEMIVFYSYLGQFYTPLNRFSELNMVFATSTAAIERIFELFDVQPDVKEKKNAVDSGKSLKGIINFKNVSFEYEEGKPILRNINLKIEEGKKIAVVGTSGCGKSTLINLIPRFYDTTSGNITIGGIDVKDYTLKCLRENIGMVLQETILFSGTLRENILYANLKASDEDIIRAAKAANAYEFIEKLPEGLNTEVGEKGLRLSGGQRQRLALTRVFLKDPKIVILDEATSALDSKSENYIQEALERLMKDRTTISIAHRLTTVIDADVIVVMDKGEIIEKGKHEELLKNKGLYSQLFEEQFKDVKEIINKVNKEQ